MLNTQLINYSGENNYGFTVNEVNALENAKTFDSFDLNIIDLRSSLIWRTNSQHTGNFDSLNDFKSLSKILRDTSNSQVVFMLPQNIQFKYYLLTNEYYKDILLKDMILNLEQHLKNLVPLINENLHFGKNDTLIDGEKFSSDFYFTSIPQNSDVSLQSIGSKKYIAYKIDRVTVTTLSIENQDQLRAFLLGIQILTDVVEDSPGWMEEIRMFDDQIQNELIENKTSEIKAAKLDIENAEKVLFENNRLKSILFTQSDSLVEVVFEMLEELTGCDLSEFEDLRKEDFIFEIEEKVFIGEIKGVNTNIKNANVSQLDVHYQDYLDKHEEVNKEKIYALLIMNHQRNKPLGERQPVSQDQVELARRNGSLIIETVTLLKMLEQYREGKITRDECIKKISDKESGILVIND